jgi:hypothetical protein
MNELLLQEPGHRFPIGSSGEPESSALSCILHLDTLILLLQLNGAYRIRSKNQNLLLLFSRGGWEALVVT